LVCAAGFLDFVDTTIVNVALPSIRHHLHFSAQSLQWILSGYLLTYGGLLLLGGRAADLLGRRRLLVVGTSLFGLSSLAAGLAGTEGALIGARLAQGIGAAMMTPAALSILTTSFAAGTDRIKAIGVWSATIPLASAIGVVLGGVLSQGPGWRWVFFANVPISVLVLGGARRLLKDDRRRAPRKSFDAIGAILSTAGMLLLVYAVVNAPDVGWGKPRTIGELAGALALLTAFIANEQRHRNPLVPFSIFRIKGLAAADATQLLSRTGTRPIIVAGALLGAGGVYWLSRIPVHGSYLPDLLPGLVIMALGLGGVMVGVQTAANANVPPDKAGLAAALITTSSQLGAAIGLAILTAVATSRTHQLVTAHALAPDAITSGFQRALAACSIFLLIAALIAARATNTRALPAPSSEPAPVPLPHAA
jgi:MFS family permease